MSQAIRESLKSQLEKAHSKVDRLLNEPSPEILLRAGEGGREGERGRGGGGEGGREGFPAAYQSLVDEEIAITSFW